MKTFSYTGFTEAGGRSRGIVEAADLKSARENLLARGIYTEKLEPSIGSSSSRFSLVAKRKLSLADKSMFYREFSVLLASGLSIDQAFEIIIHSPEFETHQFALAGLRDRVQQGESLEAGLQNSAIHTSPFELALVHAGEQTGKQDVTLGAIADYLEEQHQVRERIGSALFYPCIVACLGLVVAATMMGFILPHFEKLMTKVAMDIPSSMAFMIKVSDIFRATWFVWILVLAAIPSLAVKSFRIPSVRLFVERLGMRTPGVGGAWKALMNLRFSRTLSLLLRGGVPLSDGLAMAGNATGSQWLAAAVNAKLQSFIQGQSLAATLGEVPVLNKGLKGWVLAGEASGDLAGVLDHAANRFQSKWESSMARLMTMLEALIILLVGLFILGIALGMLQPILSMNDLINA